MVKSRLRILFVSYTADRTGPTNSLLLLLRYLRNNYDVAVLLRGEGQFTESLLCEQIPFFSFPSLAKWSIPSMFHLIRHEQFDLVYGNTTHGSSRNALIAAKLARVPFICHVRAMANGRPWMRSAFLNLADAVVTVSAACSASLQGRVLRGSKIRVVHNAIDTVDFGVDADFVRSRFRQNLNVSDRELVLINVGRIQPEKGQEYAIRALDISRRYGTEVDLLLVGGVQDADFVGRLRSLIDDLNLHERVKLTGFRQDIPALLSVADIYIHTSVEEAHPRAILEAMAIGLPVVAFAVGGVTETVVHGQTGLLVPQGDVRGLAEAILSLAETPYMRVQMGLAGRRRVETFFSAAVTAEKVACVIDSKLRTNRTGVG